MKKRVFAAAAAAALVRRVHGRSRRRRDPHRHRRVGHRPIRRLRRTDGAWRRNGGRRHQRRRRRSSANSSCSRSATTPAKRNRRSPSPTRWSTRRSSSSPGISAPAPPSPRPRSTMRKASSRSRRLPRTRCSPNRATTTCSAPAGATTSRGSSPETSSRGCSPASASPSSTTRRPTGRDLADETKKALNAAGVEEALYEAYTAGEKDYTALVSKLKADEIDIVYLGGYHTEAGLIVRQADSQGLDARLVSGDALVTEEFWSITGEAGEGTLFSFSPDPTKNEAAAEVVARFQEQGYKPEGYTLYTYAAIQVFAQAAEAAGGTDIDALVEQMRMLTFDNRSGRAHLRRQGRRGAAGLCVLRVEQRRLRLHRHVASGSTGSPEWRPTEKGAAAPFPVADCARSCETRAPRNRTLLCTEAETARLSRDILRVDAPVAARHRGASRRRRHFPRGETFSRCLRRSPRSRRPSSRAIR